MFDYQLLTGVAIESFSRLTFPSYRHNLATGIEEGRFIAVGAYCEEHPVGLALAELMPDERSAQLLSVAVLAVFRQQGVGTALLSMLEEACVRQGANTISVTYGTTLASRPALENLLKTCGWREARPDKISYFLPKEAFVENHSSWSERKVELPPGFSFCRWNDLSAEQENALRKLMRSDARYRQAISPWKRSYDSRFSMALLYEGQVVGWQMVYEPNETILQYTNLFVREDLRKFGVALALQAEISRLQIEQKFSQQFLDWTVAVDNTFMQKFVESFLRPFNPKTVEYLEAKKNLILSREQPPPQFRTLPEALDYRGEAEANRVAFTFLLDGETQEEKLNYGELQLQARQLAQRLNGSYQPGTKVLLCLPSGLDFIKVFFGCLYAGLIAVPVALPDASRLNKTLPRLQAVIKDAKPALAITTAELLPEIERLSAANNSPELPWLSPENLLNLNPSGDDLPVIAPQDIAFLMYTSGSTADPKGVMVDHASALFNLATFPGFIERPLTGIASWLPFYHDLGLFLGILHPLYRGVQAVLMEPLAFVQKPFRWLEAISRYRLSATGGPNFAYDLCVQKISPEERASLDLSCWNLALNGAEPVRTETLQRFSENFWPCAFSPSAFYPSYGLAEAPCTVSGGYFFEQPYYLTADKQALGLNQVLPADTGPDDKAVTRLVGCGGPLPGQRLAIVDPDTLQELSEGQIGEIWVSGPGIPPGYWQRPAETQATFRATLAGKEAQCFLRTGDLGFQQGGELFITGRLKDLLIIRGRNYYPQDLEKSVEECHPAIRKGCQGAFALEVGEEERAVVVCEINGNPPPEEVVAAIRQALSETEEINLYAVMLLPPGGLPKTSSGKLQRRKYRQMFVNGKFQPLFTWKEGEELDSVPSEPREAPKFAPEAYSLALAIEDQLMFFLNQRPGLNFSQIDLRRPLFEYFEGEAWRDALEQELGQLVKPGESFKEVLERYGTIESLARYLAGLPAPSLPSIEQGRTPPTSLPEAQVEPIAIIGMSCRFPGAVSLEEFWQLLCEGKEALGEVPPDRWDIDLFYDPDPAAPGKMISRRGGFLKEIDRFDPFFFGISPHEAPQTDPRQRLLLETAWEALEDAGIPVEKISGSSAGVYVADLNADYGSLLFNDFGRVDAYSGPGAANSVLANRLSYFLNLHGPSMAIDTACSGSLVALHLACQSLRSGESELALVGGVNVILRPDANIFFSKAGALSPDGRCKTFDAGANGMVRSEGAGILILKPLSQAQKDADHIYAVIRGSAVNSDGHSKGLMAPDSAAQVAVMRRAYRQAALSPACVQYVEAHGTGTAAGDPQELEALGILLKEERPDDRLCAVGSVKSNIGHTEAAAGMAGLIKVALSLKNRRLPASLHFRQPNPLTSLARLPLVIQRQTGSWLSENEPLVAGVSSFGFGGTNAHVVLTEPPEVTESLTDCPEKSPAFLLPLSAKTEPALRELAAAYRDKLLSDKELSLSDLAYTLSQRRSLLGQRLAVVGTDAAQLAERLDAYVEGKRTPGVSSGSAATRPPQVIMVFSGQGSHWLGMGRELMDSLPVFRARMEECDRLFQACTGWSILDELYNVATPEASRLASTDVMQPAIFAVQVALAAVWQDWGVTPAAVTGQSLGEVAAAFVAGALTLEEAVKIVAHRSRLMKTTAGQGLTAVVGLSLEQTRALLVGRDNCLSLAGSNSPSTSVLSGAPETLTALVAELESQGIFCRILPDVDVAFHSYQMEPLVEPLRSTLHDLQPVATRYPFYSAVTGALRGGEELNGAYWTRNLREPFLFSKVTERLLEDGFTCFLEVSPHPVLSGAIGQTLKQAETAGLILGSLSREKPELAALFASLGQLYVAGYPLNWPVAYPQGRFTGGLPAYPWQRERYWFDQLPGQGVIFNILNGKTVRVDYTSGRQLLESGPELHPLLGHRLALSLPGAGPLFQSTLSTDGPAYLQDHKVEQKIWLPGAAYLEMGLAAARQLYPDTATIVLEDSRFHQGLLLAAGQSKTVQLALVAESPERLRFRISSLGLPGENGEANWNLHAGGTLQRNSALPPSPSANLAEIQARCTEEVSGKAHYEEMARRGLEYGPAFQTIQKIWRRNGEALGAIELSLKLKKELDNYQAHPTLLDAAFQLVAAALPAAAADGSPARTYLPESMRELRLYRPLPARLWARVRLNSLPEEAEESSDELSANFYLYDESGQVVASGHGFNLKQVRAVPAQNPTRNTRDLNWQDWLYTYQWEQAERPAQPLPALNEQPPGSWLIFSDQDALGLSLGHKLEARGETVWLLYPAEEYYFDPASGQAYLNPGRAEDFSRLLHDLHHLKPAFSAEKLNLRGAIYLWGAELKADRETGEVNWEESINRDCLGVTYLVQALVKEQVSLARLCLVTRASQPVEGSLDNLALGQGMLWGLGGVIANEHLEFNCLRVDLSREPNEPELEALDAELWAANAGEQIALRQDQRYRMRLASYSPRNLLASSEGYRCQPEGAYLITGGLGGLGLVTAEYLIRQGARHLMLIGRSAPSPQALAQLEKWRAEGVDVRVAQADAGNAAQLETAFASLREAGLPLRGIIHSAMTLDDALVTKLTAEHFRKVLVSKLYGSWNLHRLSLEEPLDFFLLFSSVASVIGSAGQGNYVAGNAFMDGLAHYRQALGLPATSINWPAWEEVGFAARTGAAARLENVGVMSINPRQGLEALDLTLREELPQLIVLNARWERVSRGNLVGALISGRLHSVSSEPALAQIENSTGDLSGLDRAGKQAFCEKYLIEMLSEILNCPAQRLDKSLTLYSLGLDSLIAVSMKNELENGLKVSVPMETIMQGPTIAELATVIVELLSGTSKKAGVN